MQQRPSDEPTVMVDQTIASAVEGRASTVRNAESDGGETVASDPAATVAAWSGSDATIPDAPAPTGAAARPAPDRTPGGSAGRSPASRQAVVRYVVVGRAGSGGMGTVHVAKDLDLLRKVALKEMAPDAAANPDARARFIREVQVTAQLDHPHVIPVYGLEVTPGDRPAYAMKLVEGKTFGDLVADTLAQSQADRPADEMHILPARLEHFLKVCDAVSYAHERGVIHRDLKPANVMMGSHNEVYVMDWGLCRVLAAPDATPGAAAPHPEQPDTSGSAGDSATRYGSVVGTPRYMSPEQARGLIEQLGPKSDQYALGLILQELVTLRPAVTGTDLTDVLARAAAARREPVVSATGQSIPPELVAIIDRATAADPADRYASVDTFAADLRRFLRGEAVEARPDSPWQRLLRYVARHRQAAGVAALASAVLFLTVVTGLLWRHNRAITEQEFQERRLQALATDVARQGDVLQTRLLLLQSAMVGLSHSLEEAAEHAVPADGVLPWMGETAAATEPGGVVALAWMGTGPPTAEAEALARRVLPSTRRIPHWLEDAGAELDWAAAAGPTGAAATAGHALHVQASFDPGFDVVAPVPATAPANYRSAPWYAACRSNAGTSATATMAADGRVTFCTAMRDDAARPMGAMVLTLSPASVLARLIQGWPIGPDTEVLLLDAGHQVMAAGRAGSIGPADRARPAVGRADVLRALDTDGGGVVETESAGEPVVVAYDRIHPFSWTLVAVVPARVVFAR
ncbi:MAG: protein kinase [Vicinamibacterales bacterium]|nr:protein kinase [Vicinamibacterales bacterium]